MQKILIVKFGAVGDVLRTTSLLPGLHEKYPLAEIDWVTSSASREVLLNNYFIRHLYIWEEREDLGAYSLVIGLEDDREACELVSRIKSEKIIGVYFDKDRINYTPSAWFDMSAISKYGLQKANELKKQNKNTFQQHMADLLGIRIAPYTFGLTPEEVEYGEKYIRNLGIAKSDRVVGVNTGAGKRWPQKSWGVEQTIDFIIRAKKELGMVSLILGGEQEQDRNKVISAETGMPNGGVHTLRHFASIVNQCQILLSSDSLAMHLGIALRRRLVVFFGPTSAAEIELYGLGEKVVAPVDCVVCYKKCCTVKPNCMDQLSVTEVFSAVGRQHRAFA